MMYRLLHFDAMQGKSEKRTQPYLEYDEEASELMTKQCAKSREQATSFAYLLTRRCKER